MANRTVQRFWHQHGHRTAVLWIAHRFINNGFDVLLARLARQRAFPQLLDQDLRPLPTMYCSVLLAVATSLPDASCTSASQNASFAVE